MLVAVLLDEVDCRPPGIPQVAKPSCKTEATRRQIRKCYRRFSVARLAYGSYTSTWNVPGIVAPRGCGCSLVGSGALPNSAVSTKIRFVLGS